MVYGMEILLINISKMVVVYFLAWFLGAIIYALVTHIAYVTIKRYSFGLHALNSTVCTLVSCFLFAVVPWLVQGFEVGNIVVVMVFIHVIICLWLYAPADTKARPLVGKKLRVKLKVRAVLCGVVIMIVALIVPNGSFKLLLILGAVYQAVSILPVTYKILKRSEKNYEQYEQCAWRRQKGTSRKNGL